jgi:hypothetical protein
MLLAAALFATSPLPAAEGLPTHFLQPVAYTAPAGGAVDVRLLGAGAAPEAWKGVPTDWLFVRVAASQRNMDAPPLAPDGRALVPLDSSGIAVIGVDLAPRTDTLALADLNAFITQKGRLNGPLPERGPVRVRRVESAKTIVRAGDIGKESGGTEANGKTGQKVELRPIMDPAVTPPGSDIAIRAYILGAGAGGARLIATHTATGQTQEIACDGGGYCNLRITARGEWRVEMHELRAGDEHGLLILYSATLTFESPGAPAAAPAAIRGGKP